MTREHLGDPLGRDLLARVLPATQHEGQHIGDLLVVRIKDVRDGRPCPLGEGSASCERAVQALTRRGFDAWLVWEWDRMWIPDLAPADEVLGHAIRTISEWAGATQGVGV